MEHAYTFGMMVCNQTICYTEQAKHSEAREKVHRKQLEFLRREVERLGQTADSLPPPLDTEPCTSAAAAYFNGNHCVTFQAIQLPQLSPSLKS
ncbi:unnamed protein product [Gadus morhua 'NCC']